MTSKNKIKNFNRRMNSEFNTDISPPFTMMSNRNNDNITTVVVPTTKSSASAFLKRNKKYQTSFKRRTRKSQILQRRQRDYIDSSLAYYSTVSRQQKRIANGQYDQSNIELRYSNFITARKLYFARYKVKQSQFQHAEFIYRNLIDDLIKDLEDEEDGGCDHAQIAISTLMLALLLQRQGKVKETRATFLQFFRLITMTNIKGNSSYNNINNSHYHYNGSTDTEGVIVQCTCSAKVLQAFALFEMKQKNVRKAYQLVQKAVELDPELEPVLNWKQFRDAEQLISHAKEQQMRKHNTKIK